MRVIALTDAPEIVHRILEHLGQWAEGVPETQGSPPREIDRPARASRPLRYIPVPAMA